MPVYEFRCPECRSTVDRSMKHEALADAQVRCPDDGALMRRRFALGGFTIDPPGGLPRNRS